MLLRSLGSDGWLIPYNAGCIWAVLFCVNLTDNKAMPDKNQQKPVSTRDSEKATKPKKKQNLDNSTLKPFFSKGSANVWEKDIHTGEGNCSF